MAYTFDGPNKLIILSTGTTAVDVKDMYSRWKDWTIIGSNAGYLAAFSVLGGDPLPGGRYLGTTYFLENDWKIRPYEGNHTLVVSGNLYSRDGSDPFVSTLGSYNVRIMLSVSNLVDTVNTSGGVGTASEVAQAVWNAAKATYNDSGTMGEALNNAGAAGDPWSTFLPGSYASGTAGKILSDTKVSVDLIKTGVDGLVISEATVTTLLQTLLKYSKNRTRIDKVAKTLTIYDDDTLTPIKVFDLKDADGNPSITEIIERRPQ